MKTLAVVVVGLAILLCLFLAWVLARMERIGDDKEEEAEERQRLIERERRKDEDLGRDFPSRWDEE